MDVVPTGRDFTPLMTCYLIDFLDPTGLEHSFNEGVFTAAEFCPADTTASSSHGVISTGTVIPVLERTEELRVSLLAHGEVTHVGIGTFDRGARFIDTVVKSLHQRLPGLEVIFEYTTTKDAVGHMHSNNELLATIITP